MGSRVLEIQSGRVSSGNPGATQELSQNRAGNSLGIEVTRVLDKSGFWAARRNGARGHRATESGRQRSAERDRDHSSREF